MKSRIGTMALLPSRERRKLSLFLILCAAIMAACGAGGPPPQDASVVRNPSSIGGSHDEERSHSLDTMEANDEQLFLSLESEQDAVLEQQLAKRKGALTSEPKSRRGLSFKSKAPGKQRPQARSVDAIERVLIYEATLGMAVLHAQQNLDTIEQLAVDSGGYLVERGTHEIQVRVPAADFSRILREVAALGDVHQRDVKVRDVTAEFSDTTIRLRNAEIVRERLAALLKDAKNVEEALLVEQQLARVAEQIERMKGRLKLMRELAAFSTISVHFREQLAPVRSQVDLPFPWLDELGLHHLLNL